MSQVKAGDSIPNVELLEGAPDKKVNLAQELSSGKGLIIQVPAAFSKAYSPKAAVQAATKFIAMADTHAQALTARRDISQSTSIRSSCSPLARSLLSLSTMLSC